MNNKYLLINRMIVAVLALLAIWTNTPYSEVFASASTLIWVFMVDCIKAEKNLIKKIIGRA